MNAVEGVSGIVCFVKGVVERYWRGESISQCGWTGGSTT